MAQKNHSLRGKIWNCFLMLSGLFLLYFLFWTIWLPLDKKKEIEDLAYSDSLFIQKNLIVSSEPGLVALSKELAFRKAILQTIKSDSIIFIVNLSDSTAGLMLNGIMLNPARIEKYKMDPLLSSVSFLAYLKNFSVRQNIFLEYSNLVKEPVISRKAPSSPEEAAKSIYFPDTLLRDPAFAMLELNSGIDIFLEQTEIRNSYERMARLTFRKVQKMRLFKAILHNFFDFGSADYRPSIHLYLPADVIREIYRAIPENGTVILRY